MTDKIHNTNLQTGYYRWLDWAKQNLVGGAKGPDEPCFESAPLGLLDDSFLARPHPQRQ
jgi:hypothetical protein